jgi:hypothetical protein
MSQTIPGRLSRTSLGLFGCLLPLGLQAAHPHHATLKTKPVSAAEYRVVGFTTTPTTGRVTAVDAFGNPLLGYAAMDRQCQVDVDPNSRVATVTEWQTPHLAPLPEGFTGAWLDPGPINLVYAPDRPDDVDWIAVTAAPRVKRTQHTATEDEALASLDCGGYQGEDGSTFGLRGSPQGPIINDLCNHEYHIACAALVAVPIRR